MIIEVDNHNVQLRLQVDGEDENGDVRDLVITRNNVCWEIGLSLKHNHFAVKHSRLAKKLDFGKNGLIIHVLWIIGMQFIQF